MNVIQETTSRCVQCGLPAPGKIYTQPVGDKTAVFLSRVCPTHGEQTFCISSDARLYHEAAAPSSGGGCCGMKTRPLAEGAESGYMGCNADGAASPVDLASCISLIEITQTCNMKCGVCFADASFQNPADHLPFERFTALVSQAIARKGELEILQLSGGEPTIHPHFMEMVDFAAIHPKIKCVLINTNGLQFSNMDFMSRLAEVERRTDKLHVYLQFDGLDAEPNITLRSADVRPAKIHALNACAQAEIPVTLAVTVNRQNLSKLWKIVEFGLGRSEIHGVSYQPEFFSGRNPLGGKIQLPDPISVADVITSLCEHSQGLFTFDDMTPTPCGHPMCQWIGWLGKTPFGPITPRMLDLKLPDLQKEVGNRIRYSVEDLKKCQCDSTILGQLIHSMEGKVQESEAFRIFVKPFMDARSWDENRIARCCTHVITHDGKLDSFCRHYATRGGTGLYQATSQLLKPKTHFAVAGV